MNKTLEELQLQTEKNIGLFVLRENTYDNNLLSDIKDVDYTKNNLGRMHLQPLDGLDIFVDDVYIFGYIREKNMYQAKNGHYNCTKNFDGYSKEIVSEISKLFLEFLGEFCPTVILKTLSKTKSNTNGVIYRKIQEVEAQTDYKAKESWKRRFSGEEPAGFFQAKVDVSNIPFVKFWSQLFAILENLENRFGYGIYSIDYTRDFAGCLHKEILENYLKKGENRILENRNYSGNNVCTWFDPEGRRIKIYNKIVSNFEAGNVQQMFGGHLSDIVHCSNLHLRKTFSHPGVKDNGCTRIEVTVYGNPNIDCRYLIDNILHSVSNKEPLFFKQPLKQQYENLIENIDRNCCIANRTTGTILFAWYANSLTRRIAGVRVQTKTQDENTWRKAIEWAISDFGFREVPLFLVEFTTQDKTISFEELKCFSKDSESYTILAPAKTPTAVLKNPSEISDYFPESKHIKWEWRKNKAQSIGKEKIRFQLYKMPTERKISLLSKTNRERKLEEIEDAMQKENWILKLKPYIDSEKEKLKELEIKYKVEIQKIKNFKEEKKLFESRKYLVANSLAKSQLFELSPGESEIYGFKKYESGAIRVVCYSHSLVMVIFANTKLKYILEKTKKLFHCEKNIYFICKPFVIKIDPPVFWQEKNLTYFPVSILEIPGPKIKIPTDPLEDSLLEEIAWPKDISNSNDIPEGEYRVTAFATRTFRNKKCYALVLDNTNTIKGSYFLNKECEKSNLEKIYSPIICKLGKVKTTPQKNKERIISIVGNMS